MRKRLIIWSLIGCLVLAAFDYYVFDVSRRRHLIVDTLSSIVPPEPLVYVQCADLQTRQEQFTQNSHYQKFFGSPFFRQLQATEGWQEFSSSFEAFWNGIWIEPMRLIGTDLAVGLYKAEKDELLPGVIILSRVDWLARMTEQILYLFDQVSGQLGMQFLETFEGVPVYKVKQKEMLLPIYYVVIDDLSMVSTSLPLLQNTIRRAVGQDEAELDRSSLFTQMLHIAPNSRVLSLYLELASIYRAFSTYPFFHALNPDQKQSLRNIADFPPMTIFLDSYTDHLRLKAELYPMADTGDTELFANFSSMAEPEEKTDNILSCQQDSKEWEEFPIVGQVNKHSLGIFSEKLHTLFPHQEWGGSLQRLDLQHNILGEIIACRLSKNLLGTLYTVPDILCLSETSESPQAAIPILEKIVDGLLEQSFSPLTRQTMLKHTSESYLNTMISTVQLMFQKIFSYTVFALREHRSLMLFTTNSDVIKTHLEQFHAHPNESPSFCMKPPHSNDVAIQHATSVGRAWIQPERLAEFIEDLSQTQTFTLLVSPKNYPTLYERLPGVLLLLQALPPVFFECGLQEEGLFAALQVESSSQE